MIMFSRYQISPTLVFGIVLFLNGFLCVFMPQGHAVEGQSRRKVEQWIVDLGSDHFKTREEAMHALMELEDEPPALRRALQSPDAEVRRRAAQIRKTFLPKRARRGLARAFVLAQQGRVDEMVERLVLWNEWNRGKEKYKSPSELAAKLVDWEHHSFGKTAFLYKSHLVPSTEHSLVNPIAPKELAEMWSRSAALRGGEIATDIRARELNQSVLVASGNIQARLLADAVIISGENIQLSGKAVRSVIICDGDFEGKDWLSGCLLISRGQAKCPSKVTDSTIISGGPIVFPKGADVSNCSIISKGIPNSPVKFFESQTVGITVWQLYRGNKPLPDGTQILDEQRRPALGDGVWIKEVRKDSLLSTALRNGDIITAIEGSKTPSKEVFRKTLRRKLAEGGPTLSFTVRRGKETLDVIIPVKD